MTLFDLLAKVNQFPETADDKSPEVVAKGVTKTVVYVASSLLAFLVIVATYTRPNSVVITLTDPTAAQYQAAAASATVTCTCTEPAIPLTSTSVLYLDLAGWCDRPADVTFTSQYAKYCEDNPEASVDGNRLCPPRSIALQVDVFCNFYNSVLTSQLEEWNSTIIFTPNTLSPSGFQSAVESQASTFRSRLALNFQTSFNLIRTYELYVRPITGFGYNPSALRIFAKNNVNAVGCGPGGPSDCGPIGEISQYELGGSPDGNFLDATESATTVGGKDDDNSPSSQARFVYILTRKGSIPFDSGLDNWGGGDCESGYTSTVNIECSGFMFYLHTTFNNPAQSTVALLPVEAFNMSGSLSDAAVTGLIDDSTVVTNWEKYFTMCKPATCTYAVTGRPNASELLTVILGVLGGVTTTLKTVVDYGINALYSVLGRFAKKKDKPKSGWGPAFESAGPDKPNMTTNPIRVEPTQ